MARVGVVVQRCFVSFPSPPPFLLPQPHTVQEMVEELIHDLNQSGSYIQFLEAKEEEDK